MKWRAFLELPKWSRRRWIARLAIGFVVYSLIGFFLAPLIVKSQLVKRLPSLTQRQAAVRQVRVNPWTLSLTIRGLTLTEPDKRVFASWEEFYANFQLSSLFRWAWTFKEIRLSEPFGELILQPDGRFNFANMFKSANTPPPAPQKSKSGLPRTQIFLLNITNGLVVFEDRTRRGPFRTEYKPINVRLTDLTTRPGTASPYSFKAENETGKTLAWAGDITVEPFGSRGTIEIQRAKPKKYQPYLDDFTSAQIVDGRMNVRADYLFSTGTNGVDLIVSNAVVQLTGLKVLDPAANETVMAVPGFSVEQAQFNLRERTARADLVKCTAPELVARLSRDGSLNLLRLLTPLTTNRMSRTNSPPAQPPWIVRAEEFRIENAQLSFEDQSRKTAFQTRLKPVNVTLKQFTTRANTDFSYTFSITTESAEAVRGSGTLSINPVRSSGEVELVGGEVKKYRPYLEQTLRGEILAGKLDVLANYRAALATNGPDVVVSNGAIRLSGLQLKAPDTSETVVSVPELAVERADANLKEHTARAGLVKTTGGSILARRHADGSFNLDGLRQPPTDGPSATTFVTATTNQLANPPAMWTVFLDEIDMESYAVKCEDKVPFKPALLNLDQIALNVKGLSTVSNTPINAALSMRINESGLVTLNGTALLAPQTADLELGVTNLDLRALQPYLDPHLKLILASGALAISGRVLWHSAETNAPRLQFKGGLSVTNLLTTDPTAFEEFVKWNTLDVDGIDFTMQPERLHINAVRWDELKASLLIGPDKQPNLAAIFPKPTNAVPVAAANAATVATPRKSPVPFPVSLGALVLSNAAFRFSDASVEPNCHFGIQQLGGTIKGLSSEATATADVDFAGRVDEQSPFSIVGKVNPLSKDLMLGLSFSNRNLQLTPFTPYMEKFAGYPLNKGRLALNLHYEIQGSQLKAENQFGIDQLVLGAHNNSPDATKLPVKLAVALLKDRNGRIDLDLPVTGRLDDPQFRIGPIILKIIVNVIAKAATSPFKLLGALVGGGDELSYVEFVPGETLLREGETNKIEKLTKALFERPAVNLEIEASVDPRLDREALARQMVKASMKTLRLQELAAVGQTPPAAESFQMEAVDYERLLRAAVVKQFGTNLSETLRTLAATLAGMNDVTGGSASTNRSPAKVASRPAEKRGLLPRLVGWIVPQKKNSPAGAARQQAKADLALLKLNPELGALTAEIMEALLASKTEVPPDSFLQLMQNRAQAVQKELLQSGRLTPERVFLIAPKPVTATSPGEARVNLSLN